MEVGEMAADPAIKRAEAASVPPSLDDEFINDDERKRFYWQSRYPKKIVNRIRWEATYVVTVCILSLLGIFLTWHGELFIWMTSGCPMCHPEAFHRYAYLFFSGVFGGTLFGLKYLYKVVARGWWNEDRELWRFLSPLLAGGLAFAVGALAAAGLFGFKVGEGQSAASFVSLGFIAGYFADSASRKMQEIADILFGHLPHPPSPPSKSPKTSRTD